MARRTDYAARDARRIRRQFLRTHWWRIAGLAAIWSATVALYVHLWPDTVRPYVLGAAPVMFGWFVHWVVTIGDGTYWKRMGSMAQGWTADEFKKLKGDGWTWHGPVEFDGWDVDLVAVGPRAVLAVETKWKSDGKLTEANLGKRLGRDLEQARRSIRDVQALLEPAGLGHLTISPVLALWGPGAPDVEGGLKRFGTVTVVVGRQADEWLPKLRASTARLSPSDVQAARAVVKQAASEAAPGQARQATR